MRRILGISTILAALCAIAPASAQKATERYIPIGRSPGVSDKLTVVGRIDAHDPQRHTITVAAPSGPIVAEVTDNTRIWLDRTKSRQASLGGKYGDLEPGRTVEVKFVDPARKGVAEWIKVGAPAGH